MAIDHLDIVTGRSMVGDLEFPHLNPEAFMAAVLAVASVDIGVEGARDRRVGRAIEAYLEHAKTSLTVLQLSEPLVTDPFGVKGYEALAAVLTLAYDQSARGKGDTRHSNGKPFTDQRIMNDARSAGVGGPVYQILKKVQEAQRMTQRGQHDAAKAELLGVIDYAAAAWLLIDEQERATNGQT